MYLRVEWLLRIMTVALLGIGGWYARSAALNIRDLTRTVASLDRTTGEASEHRKALEARILSLEAAAGGLVDGRMLDARLATIDAKLEGSSRELSRVASQVERLVEMQMSERPTR